MPADGRQGRRPLHAFSDRAELWNQLCLGLPKLCGEYSILMVKSACTILMAVGIMGIVPPASLLAQAPPGGEERSLIQQITFQGLANVSETFCRNKMVSAAGQPFSQTVLDEDLRRLRRTGKFLVVHAETSTERDETTIAIQIQEYPLIASVEFVGNTKFSDKNLSKDLTPAPGDPLNVFRARQAALDIEQRYKDAGYADVRVQLDQERMRDEQRVIFVIEEGPRVRVRKIIFEGNSALSKRELRSQITIQTYVPLFRTGDFNHFRRKITTGATHAFFLPVQCVEAFSATHFVYVFRFSHFHQI